MIPNKPQKTAADFIVIALSPALIMALVGSLCFFLIEVFYRGHMAGSVRWVMFWFVVAIVLVSRIAIEKSSEYAALYGLALAGTVWFYLVRTQPAYLLGILLLAVVWFCAHKLVWDCTLIDDDEDSSGQGLLQSRPPANNEPKPNPNSKTKTKRKRAASGSPGLWVVYFSLAALPLFGVGQSLLPADAAGSRRMGLIFVVLYMSASLGLLVTTSFLGLRRYLRQRYLRMPAVVALSWLKLGGGVAFVILAAALLLPRPGANQVWTALRYQIDYRLRQASRYAAKSNPPGQGEGRAGNEAGGKEGESKTPSQQQQEPANQPASGQTGTAAQPAATPPPAGIPAGEAGSIYRFLRVALLAVAALVAGWWLFRCRYLLREIARSLAAAVVDFFRKLLDLMPARRPAKPRPTGPPPRPAPRPLADYKNPFYAGQEHSRPPAEIILYTYGAVQAWAREQGVELHPEQTAREFCQEMAARSPELAAEFRHLSFLYAHAAYGLRLPAHCDMEPLKELWRQLTWNQASAPAAR
jgi:Domain of unknown function (DUF4129)